MLDLKIIVVIYDPVVPFESFFVITFIDSELQRRTLHAVLKHHGSSEVAVAQ